MQNQVTTTSQASPSMQAPDEKIREAVVKLFAAYPAHGSAEATESAIGTYVAMLREYPLAAIVESAKGFLSGRITGHNPAFRPSVAQWAIAARKHRDEARAAAMSPKALPTPEPSKNQGLSADEIERRAAFVEMLNAKLKLMDDHKPVRHSLSLEDLAEMAKDEPIAISPRFASLIAGQSAGTSADRQRRAIIAASQKEG